ncbi:alpha-amylase family protein [Paenibacillus allorhizosphaerae]|uniref:Amidase n=1 Tax=Paenibacillus allorhizosphaerae TaxID=2849866 RepID=A0ABM8VHZ7_9BACL|nr:alpha-amylase family protein [Paenibacillus allorhizosphaerae]CAG7643062.1 hypothetical protein PAECIP111802_02946 [Paenibacillus allorhizosphaerae]
MKKKQSAKRLRRLGTMVLGLVIAGQTLACSPLSGAGGSIAKAAAPEQQAVVSTWMWNPYLITDKDNTLRQLAEKGVNRLYLFIDPDFSATYYKEFIRAAHAGGIKVHAMSGAPDWVLPEHNYKMYKFIYWVKQYNAGAQAEEQFDGIHLDVEPYVMPQWKQQSDAIIGLWTDTVSGFVQEVKSDTDLTVGIDMPVWIDSYRVRDGYGGMTTLSDRLIRMVEQVTLMAYIDNAKDIIDSVKNELAEADLAGVPALIAVDTVDSGEPGGSFYTKGYVSMNAELGKINEALGSHASYKGTAVHEWDSWLRLGN